MTERRQSPTSPQPGGRRYLTVGTIAVHLDVTPKTVRKWITNGLLVAYRFAGEWRVNEDDFTAFKAAARFSPDSPSAPSRVL